MEVRSFALAYALKGWPVLPLHSYDDGCCTCGDKACRSPAKHPITQNGLKDASADPDVIHRWMDETQDQANIGISTGKGLIVMDIDAKSGGFESRDSLESRFGKLPPTLAARTGGDGEHSFFTVPDGMVIGNKVGILPGIDIRGDGGYVVAAPSLHASGQRYCWINPMDTPVAPAPKWLLDLLTNPEPRVGESSKAEVGGSVLRVQPPSLDLSTDPGAPEGRRHARLCQLIGIHLARGDSIGIILFHALDWGSRCEPPMDEDEVRKTVKSLADKHASHSADASSVDAIDAIQLPPAVAWPVLGEDALHGLAGEIVRLIAPQTESDPVAILISILVCVGNCVGRKVWFPVEGDRHHTNLFTCLVGDSSRGRKGTSLGRTLMLWPDDDQWRTHCIANGLSSGEGLKWAVRDPVEELQPVKEKGKVLGYQPVIKDHGVADKRLLVIESEFAQTLKVAKREGNTLSPVIRQAWDTGTLRTLTRNDPTVATDAHISILGHITCEELHKDIGETDFSNGFCNRYLWIAVKRSKMLPDGGGEINLAPLRARLHQVLDQTSGIMTRSDAARDLWHQLYPDLTADRPGLWGKVTSRGEAQTLRLSMIYALLDGSTTIEVCHLRAALAVWRYAEASARLIFTEEEAMEPLEKSLLEKITAAPGINRKKLHKALGGHVQAEAMVNALGKLNAKGKVRSEMLHTGGRPSECWWPVLKPLTALKSVGSSSASMTTDSATERTKPEEKAAEAVAEVGADSGATADYSLVRTGAASECGHGGCDTASPLTLVELFSMVRDMGGKIVRSDDGFRIDRLPEEAVTQQLRSALLLHRDELDSIVPNTRTDSAPKPKPSNSPGDKTEVLVAAEPQPKCSCGAVVGQPDEICESCFNAELAPLCEDK
jgi:hypothetical protein